MPVCSHNECQEPATLGWLRSGTTDECAAEAARQTAQRAAGVEETRDRVRVVIHELQDRLLTIPADAPVPDQDNVDPDAHPRLTAAARVVLDRNRELADMRARFQDRIVEEQARLAAIPDAAPILTGALGPVTIHVLGCETHALDLDTAALLHDSDCLAPNNPCPCT